VCISVVSTYAGDEFSRCSEKCSEEVVPFGAVADCSAFANRICGDMYAVTLAWKFMSSLFLCCKCFAGCEDVAVSGAARDV
jgi:hypothetical protein